MDQLPASTDIIPMLVLQGRSVLFKEYSWKQLKALSKTLRGMNYDRLYILDMDGIERNTPQLDVVQYLCDDFSIYYEAGPRHGANVIDLVIAGAEIAYMGTSSMASLSDLKIALSYTENVGLKVDWMGRLLGPGVGIEGASTDSVLTIAYDIGIREFSMPVESLLECSHALKGRELKIRAIAQEKGEERISDLPISSYVIDHRGLIGKEAVR